MNSPLVWLVPALVVVLVGVVAWRVAVGRRRLAERAAELRTALATPPAVPALPAALASALSGGACRYGSAVSGSAAGPSTVAGPSSGRAPRGRTPMNTSETTAATRMPMPPTSAQVCSASVKLSP